MRQYMNFHNLVMDCVGTLTTEIERDFMHMAW
jgi:hypothetical protein